MSEHTGHDLSEYIQSVMSKEFTAAVTLMDYTITPDEIPLQRPAVSRLQQVVAELVRNGK